QLGSLTMGLADNPHAAVVAGGPGGLHDEAGVGQGLVGLGGGETYQVRHRAQLLRLLRPHIEDDLRAGGDDGPAQGGLVGDGLPVPHGAVGGEAVFAEPLGRLRLAHAHHIGDGGVGGAGIPLGVLGGDAQVGQDVRHDGGGGGGHHVAPGGVGARVTGGGVQGQEHDDMGGVGGGKDR